MTFEDSLRGANSQIPLQLFSLPELKELLFEMNPIKLDELMAYNNISNYSQFDEVFVWNPGTRYSLYEADFCLDPNTFSNESLKIREFISETEACDTHCVTSGDQAIAKYLCLGSYWQDGKCDPSCNLAACAYDGGDCYQTCECLDDPELYPLLGNNECNPQCNTTNCNFDYGDCITFDEEQCQTTFDQGLHNCHPNWMNDDWCDNNCKDNVYCNYDGNDCQESEAEDQWCGLDNACAFGIYTFRAGAIILVDDDRIDSNEMCLLWGIIQSSSTPFRNLTDCMDVIPRFDLNDDNLLSYHETIVAFAQEGHLNATMEKALQINCESCFENPNDFY